MAMLGYFDVFPDKTETELRIATFADGNPDDLLPDGTFIFTEYFCTDPNCDCQRVLVKVFYARSPDARPDEVATISYGWNPRSDGFWKLVDSELPNPFLDPFHRQAPFASELLEFWHAMIERDSAYAARIQRHYAEIRAEVGQTAKKPARRHLTNHGSHKTDGRRFKKRERKARKRQMARARKRK